MQLAEIRRAILSVADKKGILDFARVLISHGIELVSTGGTAELLISANIPVIEVSELTDFPEIMQGRVKTLHPKIYGGILARRKQDDDVMRQHAILPIDLVVVNLYPFTQTVSQSNCTLEQAIEQIDIGGSAMLRAAAKNYHAVTVVSEVADYRRVMDELSAHNGCLPLSTRFELALKAFQHTAAYDLHIADYFSSLSKTHHNTELKEESVSSFPPILQLSWLKQQDLRYGENAHQSAAFYIDPTDKELGKGFKQIQGKPLSYNNLVDSDTALACVNTLISPACVIVKHANPCGVAQGSDLTQAYINAYHTDRTSAFGGIIAVNQILDVYTTKQILSQQFVEVIIAPDIDESAIECLAQKPAIRVLIYLQKQTSIPYWEYKRLQTGLLVQQSDFACLDSNQLTVVSKRSPNIQELQDALFSWQVVKFVKSNAIVYGREQRTLGIGAGQMSRVYAAKIAGMKAIEEGHSLSGAVMASDAFFPFRDTVDAAAALGISCIIQPGGSVRDKEVIAAADEHSIAMLFTHIRHFRH